MNSEHSSEVIESIVKQFLCNVPISQIKWKVFLESSTIELQAILINKTVNSNLILNYPNEINYQKAFLKHLIQNLEKQGCEVHDDLYSAYGRLVALQPTHEYFKHYSIDDGKCIISIKENVHLITDGTTGLRTWQASLVLAEWSLLNAQVFKNKIVLELGSGVGLTGIAIAMMCSPSSMYLTDCHASVLKTLSDNVRLNINDKEKPNGDNSIPDSTGDLKLLQDRCIYHNIGNPNVFVLNLPWEDINKESCLKLGTINEVIAADIVYDSDLFDPLINAIKCLATFCCVNEFIFSCTERNRGTLGEFIQRIRESSFSIEILPIPEQNQLIWPTDTPIQLFRFTTKIVVAHLTGAYIKDVEQFIIEH